MLPPERDSKARDNKGGDDPEYSCIRGVPQRLLEANHRVLEAVEQRIDGSVSRDSSIIGRVVIAAGAEIANSTIRGPACIGERTRVVDSYIGPFTSTYHDVEIRKSEVEHSIVLEHSKILDVPTRIEESLIGKDVIIQRTKTMPSALRFMLGGSITG